MSSQPTSRAESASTAPEHGLIETQLLAAPHPGDASRDRHEQLVYAHLSDAAANTVRQILDHSESKLLFVGKLDVWNDMKAGVPEGLPMITLPLAPKVDAAKSWDALIAGTAPLADSPVRPADELCTLIYTSGTSTSTPSSSCRPNRVPP